MALKTRSFGELITFTRSTGGGRFNAAGQYEWLAANQPRFDFDPVTLQPRGILIEEQRTNLLTRSAEFDNAAWAKLNVSVVANAATAPDGTMKADKLTESATTSEHYLQSAGIATNTSIPHTFSFYFRSGEKPYVRVTVYDSVIANSFRCELDVNNAAIVAGTVAVAGTASNASASVVSVGGGVYRFSITGIPASSNSGSLYAARIALLSNDRATNNYTGDGTSGIFIWGAQLEAGEFPTSYIPTTTAQVTRAADLCSVNNLSPWYRADEGTLMVEASTNKPTNALMAVSGGSLCETTTNAATIARFSGANLTSRVSKGGTVVSLFGTDPYTARSTYKAALALKAGSFASSFNGGTLRNSSQEGVMPLPARLCVGNLNNVGEFLNGHIRRIRYIPRRISDTELQALTA